MIYKNIREKKSIFNVSHVSRIFTRLQKNVH